MNLNINIIRETIEDYLNDDNNTIKAVIFDFDGTLINTRAFRGVDREYVRSTNDTSMIDNLLSSTSVFNGIPELLSWLRGSGIRFGVVSNRHVSIVNKTLSYFGIKPDIVIGERLNCPKSIRIKEALSKLGVEPNNAIYVGDSPWDNAEARKAGCEFVGATWGSKHLSMGYNSPMEVKKYIEYINN